MTDILIEYEHPLAKTVDGRLLTDRQTDRHDRSHVSMP